MNEDLRKYRIKAIGLLTAGEDRLTAKICERYVPALKNINLFSHILVIINAVDNDISKGMELDYSGRPFIIHTAKLLAVNDDLLELKSSSLLSGEFNIYDIKPYFPCDDRVKDATAPTLNYSIKEGSVSRRQLSKVIQLEHKGIIQKKSGQYTLKLPDFSKAELERLNEYSHLKVVWLFSRFTDSRYKRIMQVNPPYENAPQSGVFATRSPVRPNPIAITIAKVHKMDFNQKTIFINELDAFNNTPIIDIIPYVPGRDVVTDFTVPDYLKHWPEWYQESKEDFKIGRDSMPVANRNIIEKYKNLNTSNIKNSEPKLKKTQSYNKHNQITIKGAKQNNLKNIDVAIPKNKLTVVTGVSGSGKSSLVFDTLYAESQRRFLDNISGAKSSIAGIMKKPEVDQIAGLPPAIAIKQNSSNRNIRSTVGTVTDINNFIRVLYAKIGLRRCPKCGRSIELNTAENIKHILTSIRPGTKFKLRAFNSDKVLCDLHAPGEENNELFMKQISSAVDEGLKLGKGAITAEINDEHELVLQTRNMCFHCEYVFFDMTASNFSFNNPESMCPECNGLGVKLRIDPKLIIARPHLSLLDNASDWWGNLRRHQKNPNANWMRGEILALAADMKIDLELPWCDLSQEFQDQAIYGSNGRVVSLVYRNKNGRAGEINRPVEGAFNVINRLFNEGKGSAEALASRFMRKQICQRCKGERLSTASRLVSIADMRFPKVAGMTLQELQTWITTLYGSLSDNDQAVATPIMQEISERIQSLIEVGVPYLTLDRSVPTLSGGEMQRVRLASQLNNGLSDLLYILDEPSLGLHSYDNKKLIETLLKIRDNGNTVVVVEHDRDTMLAADHIIDIGPKAGINGGQIIAGGLPSDIIQNPNSITGKYLKKEDNIDFKVQRPFKPEKCLTIYGAQENNLKNITVSIPLGGITCITGVSGSGKSTLLLDTLYPALRKALGLVTEAGGRFDELTGTEYIDSVVRISQAPIGRTPRSNPATYTGVFDDIRALFAKTVKAKNLGFKKSHFSFNSKDGQCQACKGEGRKCIKMHFMPDVWVECEVCRGNRYKDKVLKMKFRSKSIADVLNMDIHEAIEFFEEYPKINRVLKTLCDVGLGYLKLGQSAITLSGGEAQRIKLAKELSNTDSGKTVYILDEPTTGLHFEDIKRLCQVFERIVQDGDTLLIIEHNLDIIKKADWIIDMGPLGGDKGGTIVATGIPKQIMECKESLTGRMLSLLDSE